MLSVVSVATYLIWQTLPVMDALITPATLALSLAVRSLVT